MDTRRNKRGFTIVEILGAIVILGVLMGVAIPLVTRYISKGKNLSYETMENTIYYSAKNYVMDENIYLDNCTKGFFDIEQGQDNILSDLQYAEKFVDPNDKNKKCIYNVYGCMENEASGAALPTYKYKVELRCIDHLSCKIYRDDGSVSACDMTDDGSGGGSDQTAGPKCGTYSPNNTTWSNVPSVTINLNCEDGNSMGCEMKNYTQTFTDEGKTGSIQIKDVLGNKTTCSVNTYIDRTAPSKPINENANDGKWVNSAFSIKIKSVDTVSGIEYFEYRYPNSSLESERNWVRWANSSKGANDSSNFTTTNFSKERNEIVEVRACDYAGNCSEVSETRIMIDKTAPNTPTLSNPYLNKWPSVSDVNSNKYVITANSSDAGSGIAKFQYRYPGSAATWVDYENSAVNTFVTTPFTKERNEIVEIRACDYVGNCSSPAESKIMIDKNIPSTPVIVNNYDNKWTNNNYTISVSSKDMGSGLASIQYSTNNVDWVNVENSDADSNVTKTVTISITAEGNYTIYVRSCDKSGVCSNSSSTTIKLDKTLPVTPILKNAYNNIWAGASYVNANKYVIEVTSSDSLSGIDYYQYRYPNSENIWRTYANSATNSFTTTPFISERNEIVEIRACDNAGNCSIASQNTIKIDKTVPTISSLYFDPSARRINASIADNRGLSGYAVTTTASNPTNYISINAGTSYSFTYNSISSSGGTYYFWAKDSAGNVSKSLYITVPALVPFGEYLLSNVPSGLNTSQAYDGMYRFRGDYVNNYVTLGGNRLFRVVGVASQNNSTLGIEKNQVLLVSAEQVGESGWGYNNDTMASWDNSKVRAYLQGSSVLGNSSIIPTSWVSKIDYVKSYTGYYLSPSQYSSQSAISLIASNEKTSVSTTSSKLFLLRVSDWCLANNLSMNSFCDISSYMFNWITPASFRNGTGFDYFMTMLINKKKNDPDWNDGEDWLTVIESNSYGAGINNYMPSSFATQEVTYSVFPAFYLLPSVKYISGSGTLSNPFVID